MDGSLGVVQTRSGACQPHHLQEGVVLDARLYKIPVFTRYPRTGDILPQVSKKLVIEYLESKKDADILIVCIYA